MKEPRPQNPLLARLERDSVQSPAYHASKKLEKKLAKKVGGYRTAGSGNKHEKGDVRKRGLARLEHKATQAASFRVTKEMLHKIEMAAVGCDEIPALIVDFLDERGKSTGQEVAVIPMSYLMELLNDVSSR
jgi:hypothetical protein